MGSNEGEEDRPQDRTLRDTRGEFDGIGLRVDDRHCQQTFTDNKQTLSTDRHCQQCQQRVSTDRN